MVETEYQETGHALPHEPLAGSTLLSIGLSTLAQLGLASLIEKIPGYRIVGTLEHARHARRIFSALKPDIVMIAADVDLMLSMPRRATLSTMRYLLLSGHNDPPSHVATDEFCGFLSERADEQVLRELIQATASCRNSDRDAATCGRCRLRQVFTRAALPLTAREMELFLLIGLELGPSEAARRMSISVKTVETYRESIKRKLDIPNARGLVATASLWRQGVIVWPRLPALTPSQQAVSREDSVATTGAAS